MALNLKSKAVEITARVHLVDANGDKLYDEKGNAAEIEIYGKASDQYRQALSALNRKNIQRKNKEQPFSVKIEDNNELLAAISKTSYNVDMGDGPINTLAQFKELYSDPTLFFIKDTVQEALDDNSNFLAK